MLLSLSFYRELARFIAQGRLHCKIDKVGGIVETTRPDSKNWQYQVCTHVLYRVYTEQNYPDRDLDQKFCPV